MCTRDNELVSYLCHVPPKNQPKRELTEVFLLLFCEKNSDGTKNLRLKGKDMSQRINRRLDHHDMWTISYFLFSHPEVVKVDLCYNNFGDKGVQILVDEFLSQPNNLRHLNLMCNDITKKGAKTLCDASETIILQTLRLSGNKIGTEGGALIAELLGKSETLEHLDVGDADQTIASVMYFVSMIREDIGTNKTLKILDLSRIIPLGVTHMYQYDPEQLAYALGEMLKMNSTLLELHVQKCQLDGHDIEKLLIGLKYNKTLRFLDVAYNNIGCYGLEQLSLWLQTRPNLLGLNVAGNQIGNSGARALSLGLPYSKLRLLDISNNKMNDVGLEPLMNNIKKPYVLRVFYLWGNKLGPVAHRILRRLMRSRILFQENIDVKLYLVDGTLRSAFYPSDHYKQRYYCVMTYGCPDELRIKRNIIEDTFAQPKAKIDFEFYDRRPPVDHSKGLRRDPCDPEEELTGICVCSYPPDEQCVIPLHYKKGLCDCLAPQKSSPVCVDEPELFKAKGLCDRLMHGDLCDY